MHPHLRLADAAFGITDGNFLDGDSVQRKEQLRKKGVAGARDPVQRHLLQCLNPVGAKSARAVDARQSAQEPYVAVRGKTQKQPAYSPVEDSYATDVPRSDRHIGDRERVDQSREISWIV